MPNDSKKGKDSTESAKKIGLHFLIIRKGVAGNGASSLYERVKTMKKQKVLIASGCAVVAALGIGVAVFLNMDRSGLEMEANATVGEMPGIDAATRLKQLQEQLDNSKIAFSVNTNPMFSNATRSMNLLLENPANNAKLLTAEIVLAGEEEPVYTSKAIAPGSYLETVTLSKTLSPGSHEATVYLKAYDQETQAMIGQTGATIRITAS